MRKLTTVVRGLVTWPAYVATRPPAWSWRGLRYLAGSFRFWLLVILAVMVLLVAYHALADRYTPFATDAYVQAYVVQIAPQVAGKVVHVYAREGETARAGAVLFEIDPRPFEHKIAQLEAQLVEVTYKVKQMETEKRVAQAEHTRLVAEADYAATVHRQEQQIYQKLATTERKYLEARDRDRAARAAADKAAVQVQHVEEGLEARVGREHALVARVKAELAEARLNLSFTSVHAPCDGLITDLQLRDGTFVHVGQAAMTLIDTSHWQIVAHFRENALRNLEEGQPALVALQGAPGRLLPARVASTGGGVFHGQGVPSGNLPAVKRQTSWVEPAQRFQVRLVLEEEPPVPLRVGMTGSASVYVEPEGRLHEVTRGLHQLIAWLYYL
jgi:multidrug resistance efflux pump